MGQIALYGSSVITEAKMAVLDTKQQLTSKISEATEAGEKFVELFYDTVDKRRQVETSFPFGAHHHNF